MASTNNRLAKEKSRAKLRKLKRVPKNEWPTLLSQPWEDPYDETTKGWPYGYQEEDKWV